MFQNGSRLRPFFHLVCPDTNTIVHITTLVITLNSMHLALLGRINSKDFDMNDNQSTAQDGHLATFTHQDDTHIMKISPQQDHMNTDTDTTQPVDISSVVQVNIAMVHLQPPLTTA